MWSVKGGGTGILYFNGWQLKASGSEYTINNAGIRQWMKNIRWEFYERSWRDQYQSSQPLTPLSFVLKLSSLKTMVNVSSGLAFIPMAKKCPCTVLQNHLFTHRPYHSDICLMKRILKSLRSFLGKYRSWRQEDFMTISPVSEFVEAVFKQLRKRVKKWNYFWHERFTDTNRPDGLKAVFVMNERIVSR